MTLDEAKCAIGDLARPTALVGMVASVFVAIHDRSGADVVGALCLAIGGMYGAKSVEQAVVGQAQAMASGGAQP